MKKLLALVLIFIAYQYTQAMNQAPQEPDYYEILGVPKDASTDDINRAHRRLAVQYHPDKNKDADATEKMKAINNAHDTLKDEAKRQKYNRAHNIIIPKPKDYPTDKDGVVKLYHDLLQKPQDGLLKQEINWAPIKKFCDDQDLQELRQDLEVAYLCKIAAIIIKLIGIEPLTRDEKISLINDKGVESYYIGSRKMAVDYVDKEINTPLRRDTKLSPEDFYMPLINRLMLFTPSTGAKIINLYVNLINEYISQNRQSDAQRMADMARAAAQTIQDELQALHVAAAPKFGLALGNLDDAIASIQNISVQKKRSVNSDSTADTSTSDKGVKKQELSDEELARQMRDEEIKTAYDFIKKNIGKVDWVLIRDPLMFMAFRIDNQYCYSLTADALKMVRTWAQTSKATSDAKKVIARVESQLKEARKKINKKVEKGEL